MAAGLRVGPSPIHGRGVFATTPINAGEHIGTYEGHPTDTNGTHVLWIHDGEDWTLIEGTGPLRWLNHADEPNSEFEGAELHAITAIGPGVEITFDYGPEWRGRK